MSLLRAVPHPAVRGRFSRARIRALATPTRLDLVVGGVVLLVYAVVQLVFLLGPHPFDPARYFRRGLDFPDVNANFWTLRIGLMLPLRIAVAVFGSSEAALYAVPIAVGLMLAAAVYGTMLVLFGDRLAAAAAALVTVLNADFLLNSSFVFPDTTATATFAAGVFFLALGSRSSLAERWGGGAQSAAAVFAGVLFGWSYLVREFSPVLLPVVVAAVLLLGYPIRRMILVAGAAVATASLEFLFGQLIFGRPFVHLDLLLTRGETVARGENRASRLQYIQSQVDNPLDALLVFPRLLVSWRAGWLVLFLVVILLAAVIVFRRDRRLWLLAVWFFGFWAVMVVVPFVPTSSGRWLLNVTNVRYWYPLFPALAMGAFGGLLLLLRRFLPRARLAYVLPSAAPVLAALVLVPGLVEFGRCADRDVWRNDPAERWDELRAWFATGAADQYRAVQTDRDTARLLPAFTTSTFGDALWRGPIRPFRGPENLSVDENPERFLLLLHYERLTAVSVVETTLRRLRADWKPLFVSSDGAMVVLAYRPAPQNVTDTTRPWWEVPESEVKQTSGCGLSPYEPPAR